jgi:lipoate-protein ligase B
VQGGPGRIAAPGGRRTTPLLDLGLREYEESWELQKQLLSQRQADLIEDTLILVEHPHVITLGRRQSSRDNVIDAGEMPVVEIERGGDVTYHGPGQLVGYPILKLVERDLHQYLRDLETALIGVCAQFGIEGSRKQGWTGVWIGERKVASIGIAVRKWVTLHGFALNVSTELARFASIRPCSLEAAVMTSLSEAAKKEISVAEVKPIAVRELEVALRRKFS